jgi:hypothetical protein
MAKLSANRQKRLHISRYAVRFGLLIILAAEVIWLGLYLVSYSNLDYSFANPQPARLSHQKPPPVLSFLQEPSSSKPRPKSKPTPPLFEFPAGGRTLFPKYRLIALYGTPKYPVLGALGQQSLSQSIARTKALAKTYQPLTQQRVLPAFEIIATVASASSTDNGDYSNETPASKLRPWVMAAQKAGVYVILDLQPGRSNFLTQAKEYENLLKEPNVGLALDPEWRLTPKQVPLAQIGSVGITEVNQTAAWLAKLTKTNKLPQKLFLLHQFRLDMINGRQNLNTSYKQLAYTIQMDGQGSQSQKTDTWHTITAAPHPKVRFGWKNFYQKDTPILSPKATMAIKPTPWYISYQ